MENSQMLGKQIAIEKMGTKWSYWRSKFDQKGCKSWMIVKTLIIIKARSNKKFLNSDH